MASPAAPDARTHEPVSMQEAILRLQTYWSQRGCLLGQPFNTEVGAGTMNPATLLSVLGPERWNVAYVEPSVRPDDSRYGENPNRLQTHTQFQVILKPEPGDPQELYLGSLAALGIDLDAHDVRFVEDNWAQPAIGAWGLGWEVWLDGMEITQFTYFQQVAGQNLSPIPVEITYGLERILMAIQGVTHFKDIRYAPGVTYGEVFGQSEYEMSRYYLDDADVEATRRLLEAYSAEADRMISAELPVPAHTHVLKSSHAFNILDSRGAVSTAERAKWFGVMRAQSRQVAALWTRLREQAGHPRGIAAAPALAAPALDPTEIVSRHGAQLLLEIGTEELPPQVVDATIDSVDGSVREQLALTALAHGTIRVYATPRRITVSVADIAAAEPDTVELRRGPKRAAAYDADGNPTPALTGFLRAHAATLDAIEIIEHQGAEHVAVKREQAGRPAAVVLTELCTQLVTGLRASKNMRWADPTLSFSRPIRWLVALLDDTVLPVTAGALAAGRTTRVPRQAAPAEVDIPSAQNYYEVVAAAGITLDRQARREQVVTSATALAAEHGGVIDVNGDTALIDEITNLVETPVGVLGEFDPRYLELPEQITTTVMRKHQRYLPVRDRDGALMPMFVTIANGAHDPATVRSGNQTVLRARLEDASFFYAADLKVSPREFRKRLSTLLFHERLGTMAERAERIAATATALAELIGPSDAHTATLRRAGELAKFDLASQMVVEMTSLAGTMAREYATQAGEPADVATALWEMELPRHGGDSVPDTIPGALLALADRFDLVVGMLAVSAKLTGTSDPYGLRRAASGIVAILRHHAKLEPVTISAGLAAAADQLRSQRVSLHSSVLTDAEDLIATRYAQRLREENIEQALRDAVRPAVAAPYRADQLINQLTAARSDSRFARLVESLQRIMRILPDNAPTAYDPTRLTGHAEQMLISTLAATPAAHSDLQTWASQALALTEPLERFFDDVLVIADDPADRAARLGLLVEVLNNAPSGIDWRAVHQLCR
ncbi:glycine--tRNA ligase [Nocardia asiatica]|uniref:glycine--tRNA ligase n=1 Tax=Nocardia asiatica TaxID=209252 RepID=UPI00245587C6|nr:glycine--tRNA ligase [Nocardia asiatica]